MGKKEMLRIARIILVIGLVLTFFKLEPNITSKAVQVFGDSTSSQTGFLESLNNYISNNQTVVIIAGSIVLLLIIFLIYLLVKKRKKNKFKTKIKQRSREVEKINALLEKGRASLEKGNRQNAKDIYNQIRKLYQGLPKTGKQQIHSGLMRYYHLLSK